MNSNAASKAQVEYNKQGADEGQDSPSDILTWTEENRTEVLSAWATAVRTKVAAPTAVLVAWSLEGLVIERGYAFLTDATIARRIGLTRSTTNSVRSGKPCRAPGSGSTSGASRNRERSSRSPSSSR